MESGDWRSASAAPPAPASPPRPGGVGRGRLQAVRRPDKEARRGRECRRWTRSERRSVDGVAAVHHQVVAVKEATLGGGEENDRLRNLARLPHAPGEHAGDHGVYFARLAPVGLEVEAGRDRAGADGVHLEDRKSTRLNSSHANISYAVFCLKKKNLVRCPCRCRLRASVRARRL